MGRGYGRSGAAGAERHLIRLTRCVQSDVFACVIGADLHSRLSVRDHYVPLRTGANGAGSWSGMQEGRPGPRRHPVFTR